ncbi:MAG TPA: DUF1254 domain-containing protein [Steroidobacteraceae bacterium]|nr:DUF1254 domain-containing protein [Steroidobacteraceae bacterium]
MSKAIVRGMTHRVLANIGIVATCLLLTTTLATVGAEPGPFAGTRITEAYARMVARDAYFWAWPMVNVYNRRLTFKDLPEPGLMGGIVPVAPLNRLSMLSDYIEPQERMVACPNQDVVYGAGSLGLDVSPVVMQVPDFGKRFWVYQVVDVRTDSFADIGAMYGTQPGFYLLVGPNWKGEVPKGITKVFHARTSTGFVIPRVFQDDNAEDRKAVQPVIDGIDMYPLAMYDGKMKHREWARQKRFPAQESGDTETKWVVPEKFFDELPAVMKDAPPLAGEQARYAQILAVLSAAQADPALKKAMIDEASKAEADMVEPLFQFRNHGLPLASNWTTQNNGAQFGTDYFTRTAVAKSNIFVNKPNETKYFYQDLDAAGARLTGANRYSVTFAKGQVPPVRGFWSLTLYNENHFFSPNPIKRYSLGTKNKGLKPGADGSLTIYVQPDSPGVDKEANWLPSPKGGLFSLYVRTYWPQDAITSGQWTPPAVTRSP